MKKRMFALLITAALLTACSGKTGPAGTGKAAETKSGEAQKTENAAAQKVEGAITDALEKITGSIPESVPAGEIVGGASLEKAQPLEFNTRYHGRYTEGEVWVSFTTGPDEDVPYTITATNLTPESPAILGYVCGKDGEWVKPSSKANNADGARAVQAGAEGTANSGTFESLEPKTTYYLRITCDKKADYSLRITDPKGTPFDPDEDRRTLSESDPFEPGLNQDEAPLLLANTRYTGKYTEGFQWVAFHTGAKEDVPCRITLENLSGSKEPLDGYLVDEYGNGLKMTAYRNGDNDYRRAVRATNDGTADTAMFDYLTPDTTYYLRLQGKSKAAYSLRFTDPEKTAFDTTAGRKTLSESDPFEPGLNQDEAPLLLANTRYTGKYTEGFQWVAFHTGAKEDVPYRITLENLSGSKEPLDGYLVDEYGNGLKMTAYRNGDNDYRRAVRATNDGTADTAMFDYLTPDTTYYLRLQGRSKVEYVLTFGGPEESVQAGASSEDAEGFVTDNTTDVPGTSQSFALNIPLETKVSGRYTDGYSWLAFTTTDAEDAKYYLTLINCSVGSGDLDGYLVDGYGNGLRSTEHRNGDNDYRRAVRAKQDGRADTAMFDSLTPNTTYYLRLQGKSKADYTFKVSSPSAAKEDTYTTSSSLSESVGKLDENAEFYTGTNQNIATMLKTNTRYHGHYTDGYSWVAFTTGEEEGGKYYITLENLVPGSQPIDGYLVDAYGTGLKTTEHRNGDNDYRRAVRALEDGTADTAMFDYLAPDTTYYLWIESKSKAEYFLTIGAPEPKESENTIQEEEAPFVVAYELNETQVRFVKNEAIFINEEEAREAAAPVAEILLANPGLTVLLAGTTAEYGSQESCVKLSQRRADAVKNLLTEAFGVPEAQLVTAGLGYEDDPFERGRDWSGGSFVETEAAKNRRVVIINAETEIAKSIISGQ